MARVSLVAWVLVSVILIEGGAFAKSTYHLRRIVKFRGIDLTDPAGLATARSVVKASESSEIHRLWLVNALAVRLPTAKAEQALASLRSHRDIEGVSNDSVSRADGTTCIDPAPGPVPESYPWGLQTIDVPAVHQHWPGLWGTGVMVAILDTGVDLGHPELSLRIIGGYNALAGGGSSADDNGHGTHVAGIIAAALNSPLQAEITGVAAPGGSKATGIRILSTTTGGYGEGSGTSQAAAPVTGAVALALQLQPGLSFEEVLSVLQTTAVNLRCPQTQQGAGRINAKKLVQVLLP
jgi:subtilisin family serine protease